MTWTHGRITAQRWGAPNKAVRTLAYLSVTMILGCEPYQPPAETETSTSTSTSTTTSSTTEAGQVWLEFSEGCTTNPWKVMEDGVEMTMVLGGQGLLMFPMPLRAGGFDLPAQLELSSPEIPMLDFQMRIEGHNYGFNDTFARIPNYPVLFHPLEEDDLYEFFYLTIFVPDEVGEDPQILDGLEAEIIYQFSVPGYGTIEGGFNAIVRVPDEFEADLDCGFGFG